MRLRPKLLESEVRVPAPFSTAFAIGPVAKLLMVMVVVPRWSHLLVPESKNNPGVAAEFDG
jgi:hypothetical protein